MIFHFNLREKIDLLPTAYVRVAITIMRMQLCIVGRILSGLEEQIFASARWCWREEQLTDAFHYRGPILKYLSADLEKENGV